MANDLGFLEEDDDLPGKEKGDKILNDFLNGSERTETFGIENQYQFDPVRKELDETVSPNPFPPLIQQIRKQPHNPDDTDPVSPPNENYRQKTVDQLLTYLTLSDAEILDLLPFYISQGCPDCYSTSIQVRKADTGQGDFYCVKCKKRCYKTKFRYYFESRSAVPEVATLRHRKYIKRIISEKTEDAQYRLNHLERIWINRVTIPYFISINELDNNNYEKLVQVISEYYTRWESGMVEDYYKIRVHLGSQSYDRIEIPRFIQLINVHSEIVHLIGDVMSLSALRVFNSAKCTKELSNYAYSFIALPKYEAVAYWDGKLESSLTQSSEKSKIFVREVKMIGEEIGLTAEEFDLLFRGETIYFDNERLTKTTCPNLFKINS